LSVSATAASYDKVLITTKRFCRIGSARKGENEVFCSTGVYVKKLFFFFAVEETK